MVSHQQGQVIMFKMGHDISIFQTSAYRTGVNTSEHVCGSSHFL